MSSVSGAVKSIQDIMRKDVGVDGDAQRISQMVWMIFLKIYDDREEELELTEAEYRSPIPERYRWRNWARDREGLTGEALVKFVEALFFALKNHLPTVGEIGRRAKVVRDVFEDTYNYMKSGTLMRQVVNKINEIDFNNTADRHTFGAVYEQILKDLQSAGNAGEFYTPRAVTKFIIDRLDPQLDEVVFDPACGTGGFLTCAIEHKRQNVRSSADEARLHETIRGVEKKALPHMLCVTNMILHGIDTPSGIVHGNMLEKPYRDYGERDRVAVIATNPPFGGIEQDGIEQNFPATLRTRETADLFMALIIKLLKNGGRAAVVLPDGFLFGEGVKTTLKRTLIEECNLHTIVRLPNGVFNPYTGIKTNILFFTKGTPTTNVWFYEHPYPAGVTSYNKTKPMRFEEFEAEREWWGKEGDGFRSREVTEQAWKISAEEVASRGYNLDLKNPHAPARRSHDPEDLLQHYGTQHSKLRFIEDRLTTVLGDAVQSFDPAKSAILKSSLPIWATAFDATSSAGRTGGRRGATYGVERIRALAIDLAVRGKLVPADQRDEPASELLKRVRAERDRLVDAGTIGKRRSYGKPNVDPPYDLPSGWIWVQTADIGHDWGQEEPHSEFTYIDVGSIDQITGTISAPSILSPRDAPSRARKRVRTGTVLYSTVRPYLLNIAIVDDHFEPEPIASTAFAIVHPYDGIDSKFMFYYLRSPAFIRYVERCQAGIAYPAINDKQFFSAWFPLPPRAAQRRIVEKVDEILGCCDELEAILMGTRDLQKTLANVVSELVVS